MTDVAVKERLSMVAWMIDRYDVLRIAISRRSAIVLSADAILVTATIFLFGQYRGTDIFVRFVPQGQSLSPC